MPTKPKELADVEEQSECSLVEVPAQLEKDIRDIVREALASSFEELRSIVRELRDYTDLAATPHSPTKSREPAPHPTDTSSLRPMIAKASTDTHMLRRLQTRACFLNLDQDHAWGQGAQGQAEAKKTPPPSPSSNKSKKTSLPFLAAKFLSSARVKPEDADSPNSTAEKQPRVGNNMLPPFTSPIPQNAPSSDAWSTGQAVWQEDDAEKTPDNDDQSEMQFRHSAPTTLQVQGDVDDDDVRVSTWDRFEQRCPYLARFLKFVRGSTFEAFSLVLVFLNNLMLGIQANYLSQNVGGDVDPYGFAVAEAAFCLLFTTELLLRIVAYRQHFFKGAGWGFNMMDTFLVICNLVEMFMQGGAAAFLENLTALRVVRVFRLVRVIRLARVLKHVRELRTLIVSIGSSVKALIWTVVLLLLLIYTASLVVTQAVFEQRQAVHEAGLDVDMEELTRYFGDFGLTMLSMFEALFGGQDWDMHLNTLMVHISPWTAGPYCFYILFGAMTIMNAITGVFVDNVLQCTRKNEELYLVNNVRELFSKIPNGMNGTMSWTVFESLLSTDQMREAMAAISLEPSDARGLFKLLDADNSGYVCAQEFFAGCLRLRGPAKALDLAILHFEIKKMAQQIPGFYPKPHASTSTIGSL